MWKALAGTAAATLRLLLHLSQPAWHSLSSHNALRAPGLYESVCMAKLMALCQGSSLLTWEGTYQAKVMTCLSRFLALPVEYLMRELVSAKLLRF